MLPPESASVSAIAKEVGVPFAKVDELLQSNGMKLSDGTIVDTTLIAASPSTKNRKQASDKEKQGRQTMAL